MEKPAFTRGYLPHWDGRLVFVTFRLADSLPVSALQEMRAFDMLWQVKWEQGELTEEWAEDFRRKRAALENELLDKALGSCVLKRSDVRALLSEVLLHFNGVRYYMHTFVIMPNHVHMVLQPFEGWRIQDIMHSIKSYSAKVINQLLGRKGELWQREYYDRYIRNERHYYAVMRYIEGNPRHCAPDEFTLYKG